MKFKAREKRNSGFTLVEMLAVTAIVVILLAIGMVAVVHYVRWLRITELDNSAREIYLAAENRAVLLSAGGRLDKLVEKVEGGTMALPAEERGATPLAAGGAAQQTAQARYIYYNGTAGGGNEDVLAELLPQGTIDPALRGGCFYVVYEIKKDEDGTQSGLGSVTDVFYAEESDAWEDAANFETFYRAWKGSSRQKRLDEKKMFGYYGGAAAENGGANSLKAPLLEVINGEELTVRLTYSRPAGEPRTAEVTLDYGGCEVRLDQLTQAKWLRKDSEVTNPFQNTVTHTREWVLDTLEKDGPRFQELFQAGVGAFTGNPGPIGENFTVTARIRSTTVASPDVVSAPRNSLFADGSGEETAYVENLRHLQNLDHDFSEVEGKTAAVQTGDIDCGASMFAGYEFEPIENDKLKSYCGSHAANEGAEVSVHFIKGLKVTQKSASGKSGGLFATVRSGMEFRNVRLINTSVKTGGVPAGALVGIAESTEFNGCWIYWEGEALEELKASISEAGLEDNHYQITGSSAGGLVGRLDGGTIKNCLAATLVKGTNTAGGLVGLAEDTVTVERSYADCYLTAGTVAGLVGAADGTVDFTNVYAAGFINNATENAAGLCNKGKVVTGVTVTARNVYSAMHYKNTENVTIIPLAEGVVHNDTTRCYYLNVDKYGKTFKYMSEQTFLTSMGDNFAWKQSDSHPYSLLTALNAYPFPGLKDLPHYGDWNAEFVKPALAYFEKYQKVGGGTAEYGFFTDGVDSLKKDTEVKGNYTVPLDGYAVAFREEDLEGLNIKITKDGGTITEFTIQIAFAYPNKDGAMPTTPQAISYTYRRNGTTNIYAVDPAETGGVTYYLAPLPDEAVNSSYASEHFYQTVKFRIVSGAASEEAVYVYSPHFAKAMAAMPEGMTESDLEASIASMGRWVQAYVRTPRHLRALSQFAAYYHTTEGRSHTFRQELDLDYTAYKGYDWAAGDDKTDPRIQEPIGRFGASFNGVYHGGCHTIAGVKFQTAGVQYAGLFGLSVGTLQDIVYLMDPEQPVAAERGGGSLYLGGLAGGNSGTIRNCAVAGAKLEIAVHNKGAAHVGGLVGLNEGTIRSCAAEVAGLSASGDDYSNVYTGGLVGRNAGTGGSGIFTSYAVGYISGKVVEGSMVRVCGFVGYNTGYIEGSYAAARLESSGTGAEVYGFCGERLGTQRDNYFVDRGNFTYRGEPYNGTYATGAERATPVSYQLMCGGEPAEGEKEPVLVNKGMERGVRAVNGNPPKKEGETSPRFPLPTGVKDRKGDAVHYGQWPEELDLGNMGVYYWEKLELPAASGVDKTRQVYGVSMLKVDPDKSTVEKISTLSNARSDGGVVTDYGYGWYCEASEEGEKNPIETEFSAEGLSYTENGAEGAKWTDQPSDETVDEKLAELMPGYAFQSYHSFVPNPNPNVNGNTGARAGLYATGVKDEDGKEKTPNGTVTLKEETVKVTFEINPHFADALAVDTLPDKWEKPEGEIAVSPGTEESNPYEVRAMGQLSAINWNSTNRDTKTVIDGSSNNKNFPYLSYGGQIRSYVWKQTHDIHGNSGIYTPIAEYYARANTGGFGSLYGWFGGSFDGDDYVIENVNIQGQTSSVAGLFGVVFNGSLKNIVLYSSDGQGKITNQFNASTMDSAWYSMGTLAGIASARQGTAGYKGSAVENCSASGYTIEYKTYNRRDKGSTNDAEGGSTIGGLLGASDMELNKCAAVTNIEILKGDAVSTFGNDNLRAGGLTGVCQNKITNCYAGGSIDVTGGVIVKKQNGLFFGGIVGGGYFRPLTVNGVGVTIGGGSNSGGGRMELTNCYSYVELPSENTVVYTTKGSMASSSNPTANGAAVNTHIRALYAIGGQGDGNSSYTAKNCYYLKSEVMKNNLSGVTTTMPYDDGNGGTFKLETDLALDRDSIQTVVLRADNKPLRIGGPDANGGPFVERRISLTSNDVEKDFLISYKANDNGYTYHSPKNSLTIKIDGTDYPCLYVDKASSCMPIFTFKSDGPTDDSKWVTFRGWATGISGNPVTGLTKDPTTLPVNGWNNLMAVTYNQLKVSNGTGAVLNRLGDFYPVTDTEKGFAIPGKYSYNAAARLQGLNYPFPTILTREGGSIHVHYGDWPLNGIERDNGGAPIRLDLMQENKDTERELLTLSAGVPRGGIWTLEEKTPAEGETPVMKAYLGDAEDAKEFTDTNRSCKLTVKGLKPGQTEVTVVYKQGGEEYRMSITVQVTAPLRVKTRISPIYVFPGALIKAPLVLCDDEGNELTEEKLAEVKINLGKSQCKRPEELLSEAELKKDDTDEYYYLELTAVNDPEKIGQEPEALPVSVSYTYQETEIEAEISTLSVQMKPLPEPETDEDGVTRIELPVVEENGVDTIVTKVVVGGTELTKAEAGDPVDPADPVAVWVDNAVLLKNYAPGAEVTLTLTLELRRSDAGVGERPITQIVPMTVTIPKTDPVTPEGDGTGTDQTEDQNTAGNAAPEPEASQEARLPEGAEKKTDPVPEEEAGAGKGGTAPEQ